MKLSDIEFIRLLPQFMRDDAAVKGLSSAVDVIIPGIAASVATLSTWDQIDNLSEAELDALAWELNILWYDHGADIAVKRELVKNSDAVYKHLGTKWAVENVIETYFGEGKIEEWFEYGGQPGHFRVNSSNPSISQERFTDFLNVLNKVKRASAKLDEVVININSEVMLAAGVAIREVGYEQYAIGASLA